VHSASLRRLSGKLRAASSWARDLDTDYIKVFHTPTEHGASRAYRLHRDAGVVLGTLFARQPLESGPSASGPLLSLSESDSAQIERSEGRHLISAWWGRYVAVLNDARQAVTRVIRDPSGHFPCFRTRASGLRIYFSYLGDLTEFNLRPFSVNWDHMAARLVRPGIQSRETGLLEVEELHAGECDVIRPGSTSRRVYWHPFEIAQKDLLDEPREAAKLLRATTKSCVHAWAASYPSILHRLSGGLDSSIVLGCLQDAPVLPRVTCLTYHPEPDDIQEDIDERPFARSAATRGNCRLIEIPRTPTTRLERMFEMGDFPVPMIVNGRNVEEGPLESDLARQYGATARFGGEGGDQLFFQAPIRASVGDYLWHRGLSRSALRIAWDVARAEQLSIWRVLQGGLSEGPLRAPWDPYSEVLRFAEFVTPEVLDTVTQTDSLRTRFAHPWWESSAPLPHGKLWHILWLSMPPHFYTALERKDDPERVEPLTSQPLLELALRIPTYVLAAGGKERALARQAFAHDVPPTVLQRHVKASIEGFMRRTLSNNLPFVRKTLLDGVLVDRRMLDRRRLEAALSGRGDRIASAPVSIFDYLGLEVWARRWSNPPPQKHERPYP
jgi:asparagine synthase (glutamine-hydrolysing)